MLIKKLKKFILIIICLVFFLSLFAVYSNVHFHIVNNHLVVPHSHPYDKGHGNSSPIKSHDHSSMELLLYFSLTNIDTVVFFAIAILSLTILIKYLSDFSDRIIYNNPTYLFAVLRAPPLVSF